MVKLADALGLKSSPKGWGFESPSGHQNLDVVGSTGVRLSLIDSGKLQIRATARVRLPGPLPK